MDDPEETLTREQRRSRRVYAQRARTIGRRTIHLEVLRNEGERTDHGRPSTRGECIVCPSCQAWRDAVMHEAEKRPPMRACAHTDEEAIARSRPCVFVSCSHALYVDVNRTTGSIKFVRPELEPEQMPKSCALDVADAGGATLEEVGGFLNVTRERIRQIEARGMTRLAPLMEKFRDDLGLTGDEEPT